MINISLADSRYLGLTTNDQNFILRSAIAPRKVRIILAEKNLTYHSQEVELTERSHIQISTLNLIILKVLGNLWGNGRHLGENRILTATIEDRLNQALNKFKSLPTF